MILYSWLDFFSMTFASKLTKIYINTKQIWHSLEIFILVMYQIFELSELKLDLDTF